MKNDLIRPNWHGGRLNKPPLHIIAYCIYNSIVYKYNPKNRETKTIKDQIDWSNYYKPEYSLLDLIQTSEEYELAEGDQHPNQHAYKVWTDGIIDWLKNK